MFKLEITFPEIKATARKILISGCQGNIGWQRTVDKDGSVGISGDILPKAGYWGTYLSKLQ